MSVMSALLAAIGERLSPATTEQRLEALEREVAALRVHTHGPPG